MKNKVGIVGIPFTAISLPPLDTLIGIRPRSWALFSLLDTYGFETYLYVDRGVSVDERLISDYGDHFIRSEDEFIEMCNDGFFSYTIFSSTKLQYLLNRHPWLKRIRNAHILGAFCYDNNPEFYQPIIKQMLATTFTTPLQKFQ